MKKKIVMSVLALTPLLPGAAIAQDQVNAKTEATTPPASGGFVELLQDSLASTRLSGSMKLLSGEMGYGIYIDGRYRPESKPSVNGLYSRVDAFNLTGNVLIGELLGKNLIANPGIGAGREIVFVRHFKKQSDSIFTLPHALKQLPKNSEKALALAEGTFVSFRAPMVVSLSEKMIDNFGKIGKATLATTVGVSMFASGEFDIHVFRMKDNMVRVKLFALNQTGGGIETRLSIFGLVPGAGSLLSRYFDFDLIKMGLKQTDSKLFLNDYVFNLNNAESRAFYDNLMGQKYSMTDFPVMSVVPGRANDVLKNRLYANLVVIDQAAKADLSLDLNQRRIVRIIKGENKTNSEENRFRLNLKFLKVVKNSSWSTGVLKVFDSEDRVSDVYKLKGYSNESSTNYNLFWLKGGKEKTNYSGSLILKTDAKLMTQGFEGFNWNHRYESSNFRKSEYNQLMAQINDLIPEQFRAGIKIPKWDIADGKSAFIEREIFVGKEALKYLESVSQDKMIQAFNEILAQSNHLKSLPYGIASLTIHEGTPYTESDRINAYNKGDFVTAYSWDVQYMASFLSRIANSNLSMKEREAEFEKLSFHTPVFYEIGPMLFLKIIPESKLDETVTMRLRMSAHGQKAFDECFPSVKACGQTNIFREVSAQNELITERTFNLRHYMNEKAEIYTLPEIMIHK
ncbi:MAG: hypothetical protein A2622_13370 [Bdellovibrionales bacterium RIFCSPHIGHO2_01_FULL_40_29]|nr:MAG: hypothetical protein A2622_13370 [Bdellovibrionales bacterium RIFCSPHIGHO2_01_FULL_40_29]OFZ34313.1 MAG: hypothetical protein A3D17_04580 [Bdellovibrionales bacterium RIFCSPHIGHO2_02_FULL_40_15]